MGNTRLIDLFKGLPFLDCAFEANTFLAAVACVRKQHDSLIHEQGYPVEQYMDPRIAHELRKSQSMCKNLRGGRDVRDADAEAVLRIEAAVKTIIELCPEWNYLLRIPIAYKTFSHSRVISFSIYSHPQHVFLGNLAFESDEELREQIIHEVTHVWLYMIEELWRFHSQGNPGDFPLPSGARGKNATEILSAGYVASVLLSYYYKIGEGWPQRRQTLWDYTSGCLQTLNDYDGLTEVGLEVRDRLRLHLQAYCRN